MTQYYSQIEQDKYYIENISRGKREGFYLDIGANDGVFTSNTATLDYSFGWKGICIEANPHLIPQLQNNRQHSTVVHCAVFNTNGEVTFEIPLSEHKDIRGDLLSRITNADLDARNKKYFKKHFKDKTETTTVTSKTVTTILQENHKLPCTIDYMSLDTEGAELEALQGIDFSKITIKFMTIEHGNRKGMIEKLTDYLSPHGYKVHRINKWDIEFEHE